MYIVKVIINTREKRRKNKKLHKMCSVKRERDHRTVTLVLDTPSNFKLVKVMKPAN